MKKSVQHYIAFKWSENYEKLTLITVRKKKNVCVEFEINKTKDDLM